MVPLKRSRCNKVRVWVQQRNFAHQLSSDIRTLKENTPGDRYANMRGNHLYPNKSVDLKQQACKFRSSRWFCYCWDSEDLLVCVTFANDENKLDNIMTGLHDSYIIKFAAYVSPHSSFHFVSHRQSQDTCSQHNYIDIEIHLSPEFTQPPQLFNYQEI